MKRIIIFFTLIIGIISCTGKNTEDNTYQEISYSQQETTGNRPESSKLLVSKGTIKSQYEVKVFSTIEGQLLEVNLIEGKRVKKGELLFKLDDTDIRERTELCKGEFEQAKLRMEELLIGQGYKRDSLFKAPKTIQEYAGIKSGLKVKERELELYNSRLKRTLIAASQSGLVTGIEALSYDFVKPGQTLCTIVDPNHLIVEFRILETELRKFQVGTMIEVRAIAFADEPHQAKVRSIGSVVDEGGMVKVEAVIADPTNLIPGMTAIINL